MAWLQVEAETRADDVRGALERQVKANFAGVQWDRIPHAATWLRASRWDDEVKPVQILPRLESFDERRRREAREAAEQRQREIDDIDARSKRALEGL